MVVAAMRSFDEWDHHPQGQAVAAQPLFTLERIGEADPRPAQVWSGSAPAHGHPRARPDPHHRRPGLRPRAGRLWRRRDAGEFPESAEHRQHHRHQPGQAVRVRRPGHGRWPHRTGQPAAQRARVRAGLPARRHGGAGLRPAGRGAHPAGIVYVSLSAYGEHGPWARRRGFDSLVQTASGFNHAEAQAAGQPTPSRCPCRSWTTLPAI